MTATEDGNDQVVAEAHLWNVKTNKNDRYVFTKRMLDELLIKVWPDPQLVQMIIDHDKKTIDLISKGVTASPGAPPYAETISAMITEYKQGVKNALLPSILYIVKQEILRAPTVES